MQIPLYTRSLTVHGFCYSSWKPLRKISWEYWEKYSSYNLIKMNYCLGMIKKNHKLDFWWLLYIRIGTSLTFGPRSIRTGRNAAGSAATGVCSPETTFCPDLQPRRLLQKSKMRHRHDSLCLGLGFLCPRHLLPGLTVPDLCKARTKLLQLPLSNTGSSESHAKSRLHSLQFPSLVWLSSQLNQKFILE